MNDAKRLLDWLRFYYRHGMTKRQLTRHIKKRLVGATGTNGIHFDAVGSHDTNPFPPPGEMLYPTYSDSDCDRYWIDYTVYIIDPVEFVLPEQAVNNDDE